MNTNTMIKIAVAVVLTLGLAAYPNLSKDVTIKKLLEAHPDIDPKVVKEAYNSMMRDAFRGKMDFSNWSEERFNELFLLRVSQIKFLKKFQ